MSTHQEPPHHPHAVNASDPFGVFESLAKVQESWSNAPDQWTHFVKEFWESHSHLCEQTMVKEGVTPGTPEHQRPSHDARFTDPGWDTQPFKFIKDQYLLWDKWLDHTVKKTPNIDHNTKQKAHFWVKQYIDMMSPSNFFLLNPQAMHKALETHGQSLIRGSELFLEDVAKQNISMVCTKTFKVGKDLGLTPGNVIYRNDLMELIYYTPTTEKVSEIPILFVPPWINKYYVLDLKPEKSLVHYLVAQGFSVFMISWKNPTAKMRDTTFEDYLMKGILTAAEIVESVCKTSAVHAVGYCIGGTALTMLMAWLNANPAYKGKNPIAHLTTLCSLTEFSDPGEIKVFLDKHSMAFIDQLLEKQGFLDGSQMQAAFRLLRPNNLIWQYFSSQYLMGEAPPLFDVLFWNMDGTRLPAAMHRYYLKEFYLNNRLVKKDALSLQNIGIDLGQITQDMYLLGTEQDHIAPWKSTFKLAEYCPNAAMRYALAGSGHILGVLTPPSNPPKRHYRAGAVSQTFVGHPEEWKSAFERIEGSWWTDWTGWLSERCGGKVPPPAEGQFADYPTIMPAPGKYVRE